MRISDFREHRFGTEQITFFRVLLGLYLLIHFLYLIPYAPELFSRAGLFPTPKLWPTYPYFPNLLNLIDSPVGTQIFVGVLALLSLILIYGRGAQWVSLILWYGWACLLNRNLFISNPSVPMVGWMLLALVLVPPKKPLPHLLLWGSWMVLATGYTVSGLHKLGSPSWTDGTAILKLLDNPLARDVPWRQWMQEAPLWFIKLLTYSSLVLEILYLPLAFFRSARPWIWIGMVGVQLGIFTFLNFSDLTMGVLLMHLFTFDSRWLKPLPKPQKELVVFFDGVCGLCNSFVDLIMRMDHEQRFKFSPLQGEFAKQRVSTQNLDSVILLEDGRVYTKSAAAIRILSHLGGFWMLAQGSFILPGNLRDFLYDYVAKNRYGLFGKKESCRLPTPEERERFIT